MGRTSWNSSLTIAFVSVIVTHSGFWPTNGQQTLGYERLPASHEAMILWAMIALMTRRLAQPAH